MTNNLLTLFCLVDGESTSFSVDIDTSKTVDHLKDLIKTALSPQCDDIAAKDLTLWHVSIPVDYDDDDDRIPIVLDNVNNKDKKKLRETRELSEVFPAKPPKNTIHVIVQRPPQGNAHTRLLFFMSFSILMLSSLCRPRVGV